MIALKPFNSKLVLVNDEKFAAFLYFHKKRQKGQTVDPQMKSGKFLVFFFIKEKLSLIH